MNKKLLKTFKDSLSIAPVATIVLLIYLIAEWIRFSYSLPSEKRFLLDFAIIFGDTILLHTISIFYLSRMLGKDKSAYTPIKSLIYSINSAPKILLSYMGLMLFTQFSLDIFQSSPFPVFFLLLFFIWAPYICSFEFFARELTKREIQDEESFYESMDEFSYQDIPSRVFTRKSWWQFGYVRSFEFTTSRITLALTLVFLVWLLRVLPDLLVGFSLESYSSFTPHFFKIIIAWFFGIFVHFNIVKSLFLSLQPEQLDELSFESKDAKEDYKADLFQNPIGIRLPILCILVITATVLWSEQRFQMGAFPDSVKRELVSSRISSNELIVEILLEDQDKKFRWFSPERFRFQEIYPEIEKDGDKKNESETESDNIKTEKSNDSFSSLLSILSEPLEAPNRYVVYDNSRNILKNYEISPRKGPISIVMAFPLKKRLESDLEPLYEISFMSPFHYKEVLFTFKKDKIKANNHK